MPDQNDVHYRAAAGGWGGGVYMRSLEGGPSVITLSLLSEMRLGKGWLAMWVTALGFECWHS